MSREIDHLPPESAREDLALAHPTTAVTAGQQTDRPAMDRKLVMLRLARLVLSRRRFLFRVAALGLILSMAIALLIPPRFESTARLMPPDSQSSAGSGLALAAASTMSGAVGSGGLGEIASDFLGLKGSSDIFVGILNSRTVQDRLIQQFDLQKLYWDWHIEQARKDLANRTSVDVDRKSQIITIRVTDRNPQRAAAMVQAYVEQLDHLVSELSTSSARRERVFLEGRLQTVNKDLENAEKQFSQFASKNTAIDIPAQGKAMVEAAATLQGQLIAAQSELEGLKQIYSDQNVRVRSAAARVAELQDQLNKLGGKDSLPSSGQTEESSMYPSIRRLPILGVTYADLYRQIRVQEAIFQTLTQEYELAKVQEAKEIPTVKVLDSPDVSGEKSFPPRLLIVSLGTVFAFSIGILFVLGSATWERIDSQAPGKVFVREVSLEMKHHGIWGSSNGSGSNVVVREREEPDTRSREGEQDSPSRSRKT